MVGTELLLLSSRLVWQQIDAMTAKPAGVTGSARSVTLQEQMKLIMHAEAPS
jgi:hypothetical protein